MLYDGGHSRTSEQKGDHDNCESGSEKSHISYEETAGSGQLPRDERAHPHIEMFRVFAAFCDRKTNKIHKIVSPSNWKLIRSIILLDDSGAGAAYEFR